MTYRRLAFGVSACRLVGVWRVGVGVNVVLGIGDAGRICPGGTL
jgi:hypothetical protein